MAGLTHFVAVLTLAGATPPVRYDRCTMTQVWIGLLIAAGVTGLIVKRLLAGSRRRHAIDVGAVSEGWLSEQRAGKREDGYSS